MNKRKRMPVGIRFLNLFVDNVAYTVEHILGAIGEPVDVFPLGYAGEDKDGIDIGLDTCDNVGIHSVSDKGDVCTMATKDAETVAKHQRVGLAYEISLFACCDLDGSHERSGCGQVV